MLGSILPDIAVTGVIGWEDGLHGKKNFIDFVKFVRREYPSLIKLSEGVISHNILDDFTHTSYKGNSGFAYQNNKELVRLVMKYYGLGEEKAKGIAHNYIESGVDILLLKEYPDIKGKIRKVLRKFENGELFDILETYFQKEKGEFLEAFPKLLDLFTKYDLSGVNNWIVSWKKLEGFLKLKNIGDKRRNELLLKSIEIVRNTYKDFLNYSLKEGLKELKLHGV